MTDRERVLLEMLHPDARAAYHRYNAECNDAGIVRRLTETRRTRSAQQAHLKAGRSATAVSWHELGRAWHEVILVDGRADMKGDRLDLWLKRARIAERNGIRQLGFDTATGKKRYIGKGKLWDVYHLEFRAPYSTLVAAVDAEAPELAQYLA